MKIAPIFVIFVFLVGCATSGGQWHASEEPGFSALHVTNEFGHEFRILAPPEYRATAMRHQSLLSDITLDLGRLLALQDLSVRWSDVVFAPGSSFVPAERSGVTKWPLEGDILESGDDDRLREHLLSFISHEQVHRAQEVLYGKLPTQTRWLSEGMAEWVSLEVVADFYPGLAAQEREKAAKVGKSFDGEVHLGAWGGFRPKREALLRQVSPEERDRMLADENYTPSGAFRFGPEDFVADEVDQPVRYAAALALFDRLAESCGKQKLLQALVEIDGNDMSNESLASHFESWCKLDIRPFLK